RLAVHVLGGGRTQAVGKRALVHARADALAGARDRLDQQAQVRIDEVLVALLADEELGERYTLHSGLILCAGAQTRTRPGETRRAPSTPAPSRPPPRRPLKPGES